MVTMWRASRRLISSTRAASVVVLPDPVGPPTRTSPRGSCASNSTVGGKPSVDRRGTRAGSNRTAAAARPRSRCRLTRKRPIPAMRNDASAIRASRYCRRACGASAGRTASSMSSPSSGPSASGMTLLSTRIDGGAPATSRRSLPFRDASNPSHRSSRLLSPIAGAKPRLDRRMQLENQPLDVVGIGHGGIVYGVQAFGVRRLGLGAQEAYIFCEPGFPPNAERRCYSSLSTTIESDRVARRPGGSRPPARPGGQCHNGRHVGRQVWFTGRCCGLASSPRRSCRYKSSASRMMRTASSRPSRSSTTTCLCSRTL